MTVPDELAKEVEGDPKSVGLILHGSRAARVGGSDYDLVGVVTDDSDAARVGGGEPREKRAVSGSPEDDLEPVKALRFE